MANVVNINNYCLYLPRDQTMIRIIHRADKSFHHPNCEIMYPCFGFIFKTFTVLKSVHTCYVLLAAVFSPANGSWRQVDGGITS